MTTVSRQQYFTAVAQLGNMDTLYQALTMNTNDPAWIEFWSASSVVEGDALALFTKATFGWTDLQMTALFNAALSVTEPTPAPGTVLGKTGLAVVGDYVNYARTLLQDEIDPYRYATSELVANLNLGLMEIRRLRPDLLIFTFSSTIPMFSSESLNMTVSLDVQYRSALLYYICGMAQLRDDEATQDSRATIFLNKFTSQMLTIGA